MLGLPKTTEYNQPLHKKFFYEHIDISPSIEKIFVEQVKKIIWKNKIATTTVNIAHGKAVTEIEVFEVQLKQLSVSEDLLIQLDRQIPYHILFLLSFEGKYQACMGYKEELANGSNAFKVKEYYYTEWSLEDELPLALKGITLDEVYENFIRQIAGSKLVAKSRAETLEVSIEREAERKRLERQINLLTAKIKREKQFNKQVEMNGRLKELINIWEAL